ncbi:hypothetical protein Tco_1063727, partial [Tanacetum coccineum]
ASECSTILQLGSYKEQLASYNNASECSISSTTTFELLQTPGTRLKIPHQGITMTISQGSWGYGNSRQSGEQADWLADTDEEIDEQELEAHYSFMAKIQEVLPEESSSHEQPLEHKDDSNVTPDSSNICNNDNQVDQSATKCDDERVALANLIANLILDTEENKTILKQLKKVNASLTQELEKYKTNLDETSRALGEATSCRDSCLIALQNKQTEFEKYKDFNDRTIDYEIL